MKKCLKILIIGKKVFFLKNKKGYRFQILACWRCHSSW